ncbi:TRAM domain-containing protein (plasmid) [Haloferax mediterranei ATCC 33500]|uniref:TRAM domain-containing protein n=1 Tax=Haloferax mediterranei (strain ATCC 33500 / DSM 1411 / JCM 8866 / NBRC 14739 / NCIMB 2177 / R-4) TaxID=523841 RepID=I3R9V6_HALMT|nr:TRAM domain-containing protein [Haloferax mediterranei]AFK21016.1 hypothetical protein HFX_5182 [Haloferax mediterranei ATCC 33500]AHZ24123.1 hypothetical protein BM92_18125 [Haloferax mediterranei ATCC 33500]EMA05198.1 hypothetical protein C439_00325 [Haloferax mediterranei ATCC 33500]MDX5989997.1 TRAM domain-containing protein [Haloferax mediterranei ATCC 33500]QCQ77178.1 TRAM domain-containing protein [Haloferax mediterranei ATCC 33500]
MTGISDSLRLLFETSIERDEDRYVVSIPKELVESGSISTDELYRVALLTSQGTTESEPAPEPAVSRPETSEPTPESVQSGVRSATRDPRGSESRQPPVAEGDVRSVTIDTLGDQGDGIAKVERGFVIIVPGTKPGDRVNVKITDVKQTVAFAEPTDEVIAD